MRIRLLPSTAYEDLPTGERLRVGERLTWRGREVVVLDCCCPESPTFLLPDGSRLCLTCGSPEGLQQLSEALSARVAHNEKSPAANDGAPG
jgi:hypothetical protein